MDDKNYEIKMKILNNGESKLLKEWQQHSTITKEQFADAIHWICEDRSNYAALTPTGWEKIRRLDDPRGISVFRHLNGDLWNGSVFEMECSPKEAEMLGTPTKKYIQKIAISSSDRI